MAEGQAVNRNGLRCRRSHLPSYMGSYPLDRDPLPQYDWAGNARALPWLHSAPWRWWLLGPP